MARPKPRIPLVKVTVRVTQALLDRIDEKKGPVSRNTYISLALAAAVESA